MTAPITHRPLHRPGRKKISPPDGTASRLCELAADGFTQMGVAKRLGVSKDTLRRWLDEDPDLQDAFDQGREMERYALHNMLYRQAVEDGNATAAMFLLKARHGYKEGDQTTHSGRVNVNIALPGALTLERFAKLTDEFAPSPAEKE